jgi:hypothetical protein
MKSLKSLLLIAAAVALPVSTAAQIAAPAAKMPILKIDGKESRDVYLHLLDIQVEVTGNIASTRHTMVFKNKSNRVLEGELTFPLPDGLTVTYYALDIDGKMREAVPVDKAKATRVFEEIERRQVDPGLLERIEGNNFRTRVYPIPAAGTRTVSIGYEEELAVEKELLRYNLPMVYPDPVEKFSVTATVWKTGAEPPVPESGEEFRFDATGESYVASFSRENYRPARALNFSLPVPSDIPRVVTQPAQGSRYFLAAVSPKMETRKKVWGNELAIIWDVSLSGSQRNIKRELEALNIIFAGKKNTVVHLYFLNNRLRKINSNPVNKEIAGQARNDGGKKGQARNDEIGTRHSRESGNLPDGSYKIINGKWDELRKTLEAAVFDGGTDFSQIDLKNIAGKEILFFSDGISTLGDADFVGNNNVKRPIHGIVSSAKADYSVMKRITGKTKGKFVNINALSAEKLKAELLNETPRLLGAEHGNSIREVYPNIATPIHGDVSVAGISEMNDAELTLLFGFGNKVEKRIKVKLNAKEAWRRENRGNVHKIWAQKKIAELDMNYETNREDIAGLGRQFGIVTRNTSLIVLETVDDYIRYDIMPPDELSAEYRRLQKGRKGRRLDTERYMLEEAVASAKTIKKWLDTDFTPRKPKYPKPDEDDYDDDAYYKSPQFLKSGSIMGAPSSTPPRSAAFENAEVIGYLDNPTPADYVSGSFAVAARGSDRAGGYTIKIKPVKKDNDYLKKLTGKVSEDYKLYLKIRKNYADSPTFYFDMAEWFYSHQDRETALRVLTSIAELELENASLYRLLGYRFKEYGEYALEKFVCKKVIQWRPMEPQSYRDYALALADNGEAQAALDSLYSLLTTPFSEDIGSRSRGMEEVVITEINGLIAKNADINTSKFDKRLTVNFHVDIRVVINWNRDNADIDLHVKDPSGEECYYNNEETNIGGRISNDNTDGYGPEQFLLKNAIKGKYRIYVNNFGDRQFTQDGPPTVMAEIYTKYAGKTEQRRVVCFQMSGVNKTGGGKRDRVEVAEFEF